MTSKKPRGKSGKSKGWVPEETTEHPAPSDSPGEGENDSPSAIMQEETREEEPRDAAGERMEQRLTELEEELTRHKDEAAAAADRALRTLAEFDNYRRRTQKERIAAATHGISEVVTELLDVVDNFDRALEHAGEDVPPAFLQGMKLVAQGIHEILDRRGVSRIEALGAVFDPEVHEALTSQPSEETEPNTVLQEIQPGYMMGERVLRPAKVIVASAVASGKDS